MEEFYPERPFFSILQQYPQKIIYKNKKEIRLKICPESLIEPWVNTLGILETTVKEYGAEILKYNFKLVDLFSMVLSGRREFEREEDEKMKARMKMLENKK